MAEATSLDESDLCINAPPDWAAERQERLATPQEQQLSALVAMGFNFLAVQMAMHEVDARGLEEVVDFLSNERHTWQHPFLRNTYSASEGEAAGSCVLCGEGGETRREEVMQLSIKSHQSRTSLRRLVASFPVQQVAMPPCPICTESMYLPWKAENCQTHTFCRSCAVDYVNSKVEDGHNIHCPYHNCPEILTTKEIKQLVGIEITEQWEKKRLERNPMYHHCPKINCSGFILGVVHMQQAFCPVCELCLCSHCGKQWHSDSTCVEVSRMEMQNSKAVKACPGCERFIEKNQGCDHMTCQMCVHEWCWQCLQPYTTTHFIQGSADYCSVLNGNSIPALPPIQPVAPISYQGIKSCWAVVLLVCFSPVLLAWTLVGLLLLYVIWVFVCFGMACYWGEKDGCCVGVLVFIITLLLWPILPLIFGIVMGVKCLQSL